MKCVGGVLVGFVLPLLAQASFSPNTLAELQSAISAGPGNGYVTNGQHISEWDVSRVTDFSSLFRNNVNFNEDISKWDTASATRMRKMFQSASSFNQDIGNWDVSRVTDMYSMFELASSFDQNISRWDVSKVTDYNYVFLNCPISMETMYDPNNTLPYKVKDGALLSMVGFWQSNNVWYLTFYDGGEGGMKYNGQHISEWDVSRVTDDFYSLFRNNVNFNEDISKWDTASATRMKRMFQSASSFNQDIGNWDVSRVTDMAEMFDSASSFNQDISGWDVSKVVHFSYTFRNCPIALSVTSIWTTINPGWSQPCPDGLTVLAANGNVQTRCGAWDPQDHITCNCENGGLCAWRFDGLTGTSHATDGTCTCTSNKYAGSRCEHMTRHYTAEMMRTHTRKPASSVVVSCGEDKGHCVYMKQNP